MGPGLWHSARISAWFPRGSRFLGSKALTQLIEPNPRTSLFNGGTTDWDKALRDFDSLGAKGQRAKLSNPEAVRNLLKTQGRIALAKKIGLGALGALSGGAATTLGYEMLK